MSSFRGQNLSACMTMPRLGFTDNFAASFDVFSGLGIDLRIQQGVFWEQAISRLLTERIESGDDYLVLLDYDSLFNRQQFLTLFDLIESEQLDAVFPVQIMRGRPRILVTPFDGQIPDMTKPYSLVLTGHFGLTILRLSAVKRIPEPYFWSTPNAQGKWEAGEGRGDADNNFWLMANHCGLKVAQANQVRIGHMELRVAWPLPDGRMMWTNASDFSTHGVPSPCLPLESAGGPVLDSAPTGAGEGACGS